MADKPLQVTTGLATIFFSLFPQSCTWPISHGRKNTGTYKKSNELLYERLREISNRTTPTRPLSKRQVGVATIRWLSRRTETCAQEYVDFYEGIASAQRFLQRRSDAAAAAAADATAGAAAADADAAAGAAAAGAGAPSADESLRASVAASFSPIFN